MKAFNTIRYINIFVVASFILVSAVTYLYPPGLIAIAILILVILAVRLVVRRPIMAVYFLVIYMPFENLVLKFLPGSAQVYLAASFASEILIYFTFSVVLLNHLLQKPTVQVTPIDPILIIFVIISLTSILINQAPLLGSLVNIRAIIRYALLFYLLVYLTIDKKQALRLQRIIIFLGLLQIGIGVLQKVIGGQINQFLLPRQADIDVAGFSRGFVLISRGREFGAIFGTLGDTIYFALFMVVVFALYLGQIKSYNIVDLLTLFAIFIATNYAFARAAVFGILLMLVIFYRMRHGLNNTISRIFFVTLFLITLFLLLIRSDILNREFVNPLKQDQNIFQNISGILSIDYFQRAQYQRLGAITGIPPTVLVNRPLFGYGPDEDTTIQRLNSSSPSYLQIPVVKKGFEDVYWAALLAYVGILGLITIAVLLLRIYTSAKKIFYRSKDEMVQNLALTMICLTFVTGFLLFFYRVLEFRIFSFYFWFILGLLFNQYARERRDASRDNQASAPVRI